MTREEARRLAGQIFTARFPTSWSQIDLEHTPIANYIIFKDALEPTFEASRARLADARSMLRSYGIEPLFMMDEEGGRVTQISRFFPSAPSPRAVAADLAHGQIETLYALLSAYLADLGIDLNLAPCLDVNTEPLNPIIGTRSFGSDAASVGGITRVVVRALQHRLACVAKHFPGHGMTKLDSHLALPVVEESREVLETVHQEPFRQAVKAGVDGIMISHCLYKALQQDDLPASLSRQVVKGQLRAGLAFQGVVFTDSLDMLAVVDALPPERAALLAFEAGCDILLYTEYSERLVAAFDALVEAAVKGEISEAELRRAIDRRSVLVSQVRSRSARVDTRRFNPAAYAETIAGARAASVRISGNRRLLPLSSRRIALVGAAPALAERIRAYAPDLSLLPPREGEPGGAVIIWIWEPLILRQSIEELQAILRQADTSVVVTTYPAIADALGGATIGIVSEDSGPYAEASIMRTLFEG